MGTQAVKQDNSKYENLSERAKTAYHELSHAILADLVGTAETAPGGLRGTAYHESSHAVLAELFSFPIDCVTVAPNLQYSQMVSSPDGRQALALAVGLCEHVLNEDGVVSISSSFRGFCYLLGILASIPTERKLGILTKHSVRGDITNAEKGISGNPETKREFMKMILVVANRIVGRTDVWATISEVAELLLVQKRVDGDMIRQIMRKHIPSSLYVSEAMQTEISVQMRIKDYNNVICEWASRFEETPEAAIDDAKEHINANL